MTRICPINGATIRMMNQSDIDYIVKLLASAIKNKDWELITEVQEYVIDFQEEPQYEEE